MKKLLIALLLALPLLAADARDLKAKEKTDFARYNDQTLHELSEYNFPGPPRFSREEAIRRRDLRRALTKFYAEEKPLVLIQPGNTDYGTFVVQGAGTQRD